MSFRAFVVGADYHLQFARKDAEQIAAALKNLGYELPDPRLPPPEENSDSISARLRKFITDSRPEDTMLFYFAGHGIPYPQRELYLALDRYDPARHPLQTCLSIADISSAFKNTDIETKLIILDCCRAGKSFSVAEFTSQDNHAIIAAAEVSEQALEFKELQAGFFSYHLHNALTQDIGRLASNSQITLNSLQEYLQNKVNEHNRSHTKKVPNIIAASKQWKQIVLADIPADMLIKPVFGLQRVNRAFLAAEQRKTGPNFTPAHFYRATPDVQWWGVANDLLSEQSLFPEVLAHVRRSVSGSAPLIGLLFGSGGMGKSILLRRLGAALSEEFTVWWVDSAEDVLQDRAAAEEKLLESDKPPLVLLDDWTMALQDEERKGFQAWFGQLYRSGAGRQIKFILTARNWNSDELPAKLLQDGGSSRFDLDKRSRLEQDNPLLLDKAAEKLADSAWTVAAQELRSSNLARTKPFHLLFVMMRGPKIAKGQNVEGIFEEIIASDMEKLWQDEYRKGLAAAVSTLAFFYVKFNRNLSRKAFLLLADHRNPQYPLAPFSEWPAPLKYYLHSYRNPTNKREDAESYVGFIKDDFAEIIAEKDHAEHCWVADAQFLIQEADMYSASKLFYMICLLKPETWTVEQKRAMIRRQLERGNSHHAYAWLLLKDDIFTDEAERWELIEQYLALAPKNHYFVVPFLKWGKNAALERTRSVVKRLLKEDEQRFEVLCIALKLLNTDEAKPFAKNLLEKEQQEHQIICTALSILDSEAEDFALHILDKWQQESFSVVLRCLNIAPASRQAEDAISFLLKNKRNQYEYFRILAFPFHAVIAWQEETQRIISAWKYTSRQSVAAVLRHYLDDPFLLKKTCFEILRQWKKEIEYQRKNFPKKICIDHILTALGHSHLRVPAKRTATGMLLREKEQPGFLGEKLLQAAETIVNDGIYPDWEKEAD